MASGRRAAALGKRVCMIENRVIGGTCVNVGCVPKKVMFNLANFLEEAHAMKGYGVNGADGITLDFAAFKAKRDGYVQRLNGIFRNNINKALIKYVEGTASFVSNTEVKVGDQVFTAPHILIASGSAPDSGSFPGSELCDNSNDFFEWEELPKECVVIGGGYIGIELAQILCAMGVKVTCVVRSVVLRSIVDRDLIEVLMDNMRKLGIDLRLSCSHESVTKNEDGTLNCNLVGGESIKANKVLVATGRPPNVGPLALENTDVVVEKGAVKVDEFSNTDVPGIYAIGDVINIATLTPVAVRAGRVLVERIFAGRSELKMNYNNIATIIFSHPPIGTVGLTEEQAIAKHGDDKVKTFTSGFTNMFFSPCLEEHKQKSMFKVVCVKNDKEDDGLTYHHLTVIGVHGIGKGIDEMMQGISIAVVMGASKQDFDNCMAIHPTASEEFVLFEPRFANY